MKDHQIVTDEVLERAEVALRQGNNWMAYNKSLYFIDKNDIYFFGNKDLADEFAANNFSDRDSYVVMYISSVADILKRIPHSGLSSNQIDPDINSLYNCEGNFFTDKPIGHIEQLQLFTNKNNNIMKEETFEYLKNNIKYMGFGEKLFEQLENNLNLGKPEFHLTLNTEVNKKPFEATLHFRKSDTTDMYFFNSYNASLQRSNGEKVDQLFYLNNGKGVTAKEAYNMLEGRSVFKELTTKDEKLPYKAWLQLDFQNKDKNNNNEVKQFHENYGFDLKAAVGKYAVAELNDPENEKKLMQSLQKGNIQSITIEKDGNSSKMFIEANPQFKTVNLYDGQMKRVQKENLGQYQAAGQSQRNEVKQEQKQDIKQDIKVDAKKSVGQKVNDNTDVSKKKSTRRKGMSV